MDGHIFTRYSRFSKYGNQVIATPVADSVDFKRSFEQGPVLKFKVPRKGDLIKEIMLHIKLSDIDEATLPYIGFTSPFPFYMFQKIDLVIGDTIIETLTPDYMLYQLYTTNNQYQNDGYAYCVGNIKALIDNNKYGQDATTREDENMERQFKREFTFPLPFYFHKVISSAIPLCVLTKQEVEVHFHMRGLYNFLNIIDKEVSYKYPNNVVVNFTDINERGELTQDLQNRLSNLKIEVFDVLIDFVYIDDSAVEKIQSSPVSFFINQSQLRRFENEKGTRFGNPYLRHRLDFINPIKDIFFYLVKSSELYQYPLSSERIINETEVSYNFEQRLTPNNGSAFNVSGQPLVSSISGDTLAVGSSRNSSSTGVVFVYVKDGGVWILQQTITAYDGATGDSFGSTLSVSGDTLAVGASGDDDLGTNSGSVYVYTRTGTSWSLQQKLTASDGVLGDFFGISVSLDVDTLVVGAYGDDDLGSFSGSAYVFTRTGTTWTQQQKLTASDGVAGDRFGFPVFIDTDTVAIGSYVQNSFKGAVYIFTVSGGTWSEQQKLTASDGLASDYFGSSVSLSGDSVVIGAYGDDTGVGGSGAGSVYVFTRSGGTWTEQQKITASDGSSFDSFGRSVSIDGDDIAVGAYLEDTAGFNGDGAVYTFRRSGTVWTQISKLTSQDINNYIYFGSYVFLKNGILAVGDNSDNYSGSVHIYEQLISTESYIKYTIPSHRFTLRQGSFDGTPGYGHTIKNCEIIADSSTILSNTVADYMFLNQIQPFISHTMPLKATFVLQQPYFYTYSFALDPENSNPTGYFNPNAYKNVELNIVYNRNTLDLVNDRTLFVYARSINVMTIDNGVSTLLFENPQLKDYY